MTRITGATITPVAIRDAPLLNAEGVHQPYALRSIIELRTDAGITGLSETYGDAPILDRLHHVAGALEGLDVFDLNGLTERVAAAQGLAATPSTPTELIGPATAAKAAATLIAAFEVACFDVQGKVIGLPVAALLGGQVRDAVPYSAYLFYRWAEHPDDTSYPADDWGPALTPEGIVDQAHRLVERYGFQSLKLKGGVFEPEEELAALTALRTAFPDHPLRLDPNANWTIDTTRRMLPALEGLLEYLEDPCPSLRGMAEVASATKLPLATNMCVTSFADLPEATTRGSVQVVLSDHHFWGGFRATQRLAGICETYGLGLSMHSNSHLGISLAAMTHLAAATPQVGYACDTHTPWQREDVILPDVLRFENGSVPVPQGPGLGVELDRDALARLHGQYLRCGIRQRDDIAAMQRLRPGWTGRRPRF